MSDLQPLLAPRSIAVVGASDQPGTGKAVLANLRVCGFGGELVPVNPKYETVDGLPCVPDLSRLPHPVDLAIIAIPAAHIARALGSVSPGAVQAAVILSAGFGETGARGKAIEADVLAAARDQGIRFCGPNCLGFINAHGGVAAYSASLRQRPRPGGIGIVAQSGTVCIGLVNARADLGFSHILSTGNEADLTSDECIRFLVEDSRTECIGLFLEGVRSAEGFLSALDLAEEAGKPVVVLKAGRSDTGRRATLAHTGSLSGSDRVFRGLFRQKGVIQVSDMDEQLATLGLLSGGRRPAGGGLGVTTVSGGQCALICDAADEIGLELPDLAPKTSERLAAVLPEFAANANPLDTTGVGVVRHDLYEECLRALADDPGVHCVAALQDIPAGLGPSSRKNYHENCGRLVKVARSTDKPVALFTQFGGAMDPEMEETLREGGVPLLQGLIPGLRAIRNSVRWAERMRAGRPGPAEPRGVPDEAIVAKLREAKGPLSERESKDLLARCGVAVTRETLAKSEAEALEAAESLGYPVVLKVDSPDLPHKTEAGAVRLGLDSPDGVRSAYRDVLDSARRYRPDARINGVLVSEQAGPGVEMIIGLSTDPQFGKTVLAGMGGILAEVLEDASVRLVPITRRDAEEMLDELRASKILKGVRGRGPSDREAVIGALLALSEFGRRYGDLVEEVDINPLIVGAEGSGVLAADALVVPRA